MRFAIVGEAGMAMYRVILSGAGLVAGALISETERREPLVAIRASWLTSAKIADMEQAGIIVRLQADASPEAPAPLRRWSDRHARALRARPDHLRLMA